MKIFVCTYCGSSNIQQDAWETYDDLYCENCESSCSIKEVEVPDDFDIYNDLYSEST